MNKNTLAELAALVGAASTRARLSEEEKQARKQARIAKRHEALRTRLAKAEEALETSEPIGDSNTMKRSTDIDETVEALRTLRTNTMSSWSGCVDTAGITDCGASHDEARAQDAADAADAAEGHWDRAIEAVESGDIATAKQELEWARSLAAEWGDSTCETQALEVVEHLDRR